MTTLADELEALRSRFPPGFESSLVLPSLRRMQEARGYVADEDVATLVDTLGVPRVQIEEVLSFYTQLRRAPIGRHHVQVCRNVSCSLRGAERIVAHVSAKLGIAPGKTTPDGRITLSTVECIASCGGAPAIMIGETCHENVDEAAIDALLAALA